MPTQVVKRGSQTGKLTVEQFDGNMEAIIENQTRSLDNESQLEALSTGYQGTIVVADTPTLAGIYKPVSATDATFTNAGNLTFNPETTDKGFDVRFNFDGTTWSKERIDLNITIESTAIDGNTNAISSDGVFDIKTGLETAIADEATRAENAESGLAQNITDLETAKLDKSSVNIGDFDLNSNDVAGQKTIEESYNGHIYEIGKNLLKTDDVNYNDKYVKYTDGTIGNSVGSWNTNFIKIKPSIKLWFSPNVRDLAFYSNSNEASYISGQALTIESITPPATANYIRFSHNVVFENYMFSQGDVQLAYEPYKRFLKYNNSDEVQELAKFENYETLYQNNQLNYGAKTALDYIYRLKNDGSFDLPIHRKLALIELFQDLEKVNLLEKLILFYPYFGNNTTAGYNILDNYYDGVFTSNLDTPIYVDQDGLKPSNGLIYIEELKLNNIPYRFDGKPKVGFGHLYDSIYNGTNNGFDWDVLANFHVFVRFSRSDTNKAMVAIGNNTEYTTQDIPKDSHYYLAQRDGNDIKVFTKDGISGSINNPTMDANNLKKQNSNHIIIPNVDTINTRKKASFIIKALSDIEERVFYNLLTTYHTKIK